MTGRDRQEDTAEEEAEEAAENDSTEKTSAPAGFTVVGAFENKPVQKVK